MPILAPARAYNTGGPLSAGWNLAKMTTLSFDDESAINTTSGAGYYVCPRASGTPRCIDETVAIDHPRRSEVVLASSDRASGRSQQEQGSADDEQHESDDPQDVDCGDESDDE